MPFSATYGKIVPMKIRFSDDKRIFNQHTDAVPYISFDMLDRLGVPNLYSTRYLSYDAVSGTGVKGIRMAVMKTDVLEEASPVCRANRDRLARQLGTDLSMELVTNQKHTNHVHVAVSEADLGVATVGNFALHRQYVDGIVTNIPGALLTAFGGDCPPVYIVDPVRGCAGLVHAGWKGTLGKIPQVAIAQMTVRFGCDPADMYAAIGPGVCMDCYEMGDEVYGLFADQWGREDADRILRRYAPGTESEAFAKAKEEKMRSPCSGTAVSGDTDPAAGKDGQQEEPEGKYHLDLREANRITLLRAGIPAERIAVSNVCTMCNTDTFYSYRAGKMENEQVAMLVNSFGHQL